MGELLMMAEGLPRLDALDTLVGFEATALGGGMLKDGPARVRELSQVAGGGEVREPGSPMEAFARMAEANARARAAGQLWEQRVEREAATDG